MRDDGSYERSFFEHELHELLNADDSDGTDHFEHESHEFTRIFERGWLGWKMDDVRGKMEGLFTDILRTFTDIICSVADKNPN